MSMTDTQRAPSFGARVAAEVRAEMARQRISVNRMDTLCGKPRGWAQRRLQQETVVLDLADLEVLADALRVDVRKFLITLPRGDGQPTGPYLRRLLGGRELTDSYVAAPRARQHAAQAVGRAA